MLKGSYPMLERMADFIDIVIIMAVILVLFSPIYLIIFTGQHSIIGPESLYAICKTHTPDRTIYATANTGGYSSSGYCEYEYIDSIGKVTVWYEYYKTRGWIKK